MTTIGYSLFAPCFLFCFGKGNKYATPDRCGSQEARAVVVPVAA